MSPNFFSFLLFRMQKFALTVLKVDTQNYLRFVYSSLVRVVILGMEMQWQKENAHLVQQILSKDQNLKKEFNIGIQMENP